MEKSYVYGGCVTEYVPQGVAALCGYLLCYSSVRLV